MSTDPDRQDASDRMRVLRAAVAARQGLFAEDAAWLLQRLDEVAVHASARALAAVEELALTLDPKMELPVVTWSRPAGWLSAGADDAISEPRTERLAVPVENWRTVFEAIERRYRELGDWSLLDRERRDAAEARWWSHRNEEELDRLRSAVSTLEYLIRDGIVLERAPAPSPGLGWHFRARAGEVSIEGGEVTDEVWPTVLEAIDGTRRACRAGFGSPWRTRRATTDPDP